MSDLRGLRRREKVDQTAQMPGPGLQVSMAAPPPPPPPFARPAPAGADIGGPTGFAFPEPHPEEVLVAQVPTSSTKARAEIAPTDVLIALAAIAIVVGVGLATGGPRTSYGLGQSFGLGFAGVLLAYGARQLYLSKSGKSGPAWSVSLIPIAVALGLAGQFTLIGSVTPAPDKAAVQAAFVPLEGLEYQTAPGPAVEQVESLLSDLPEIGDKIGALEARLVTRGGQMTGVVVVMGVQPDALREMDRADLRASLQIASGNRVVEKKRGKASTFEVNAGQLYGVTFLTDDGLIISVQALRKKTAVDIAKRLAVANL